MPFRDRGWEDFQRDCDFFPAYTDYIFGVDTRPEVADEPGLHPQICYQSHRLRLQGLVPPVQYPAIYDPIRDATQTRPYDTPTSLSKALLKQESSLESMMPTPCPAPRVSPLTSPLMPLLHSNELITDTQYSAIPHQERVAANLHIVQAWSIVKSDTTPEQKSRAMGYINHMSRVAAAKRQEYQAREAARLEAEMRVQQSWELHDATYPAEAEMAEEPELGHAAEIVGDQFESAGHDVSQLFAYVQSHLPQLWFCTEIIALRAPPTGPQQLTAHTQAQQYMMNFIRSVPPQGKAWVNAVMDKMIGLRAQGGDPLTVLQSMPGVPD